MDFTLVPQHLHDRIQKLIPDPKIAEHYKNRTIDGILDFDLFDYAMRERENIFLLGPTGAGKTTSLRAYASARQLPLAMVECNAAMEPSLVMGRTVIGEDGLPTFHYGDMVLVAKYSGVISFEEFSMAPPRITAAWHQFTSEIRRLTLIENNETVKAHNDLLIAGTANPVSHAYAGNLEMSSALKNRLPLHVMWDYDPLVEAALVTSVTLQALVIKIRKHPEITTPISTNNMVEFERHAHAFGAEATNTLFINRFPEEEKQIIRNLLDGHIDNIMADLGLGEVVDTPEAADEPFEEATT